MNKLEELLAQLHDDESGEMPIGPLLIIALIVLPLVFLLITFRDKIREYLIGEGDRVIEAGETDKDTGFTK